jgi:hypothetical protein
MTLLCKAVIVAKSKEGKTGWSNSIDKSGRIFYGRLWLRKGCFANDDDNYTIRQQINKVCRI